MTSGAQFALNAVAYAIDRLSKGKPSLKYNKSDNNQKFLSALTLQACRSHSVESTPKTGNYVLPSVIDGETTELIIRKTMAPLNGIGRDSEGNSLVVETLTRSLLRFAKLCTPVEVITDIKVPWSAFLKKGMPQVEIVEKKGREKITRHVPDTITPAHKSMWLDSVDKTNIQNIMKKMSFDLSQWKKKWDRITPLESHQNFVIFTSQMKSEFVMIKTLHDSCNAHLGRRKQVILKVCKDQKIGSFAAGKKDGTDSDNVAAFYKLKDLKLTVEEAQSMCYYDFVGKLTKDYNRFMQIVSTQLLKCKKDDEVKTCLQSMGDSYDITYAAPFRWWVVGIKYEHVGYAKYLYVDVDADSIAEQAEE